MQTCSQLSIVVMKNVYDSSCINDRVDILNCDSVDATVAVTTRAQSKLNVM